MDVNSNVTVKTFGGISYAMAESLEKSDFFVVLNRNKSALVRNLLSKKISLSVSCKKVNHWPFALVI